MRIKIIGIYFGKVTPYFQLWLDSVAANRKFEWLLYSDVDMSAYHVPLNLYVHKISFEGVRSLIKSKLGYEPDLNVPWDFCKFKAVYAKIFEDDLKGVDYWGWTDFDVIYGDLTPIYKACEKGYDKIMPLGHLSLLRNDARLIARILAEPLVIRECSKEFPEVRDSLLDEVLLPLEILPRLNASQHNDIPFVQFYCRYGHFRLCGADALCRKLGKVAGKPPTTFPCVLSWHYGHLTAWFALPDKTVRKVECVYIHFFQREMKPLTKSFELGKSYLIVPNEMREYDGHNLSYREIVRLDKPRVHWKYFAKRLTPKRIVKKLRELLAAKR